MCFRIHLLNLFKVVVLKELALKSWNYFWRTGPWGGRRPPNREDIGPWMSKVLFVWQKPKSCHHDKLRKFINREMHKDRKYSMPCHLVQETFYNDGLILQVNSICNNSNHCKMCLSIRLWFKTFITCLIYNISHQKGWGDNPFICGLFVAEQGCCYEEGRGMSLRMDTEYRLSYNPIH